MAFGPGRPLPTLAIYLAWGSVVGSIAQFGVQARQAWTLSSGGAAIALTGPVREAVRNFGPVMASRGAVQFSAYIDTVIASLLPTGAVTGLTNAQLLYTLPVSLFGISISSAALPSISADAHASDAPERVRARVAENARRIAYFVVPSAVSFLVLGDVLAATLLQTGRFTAADSTYVWAILAGSAIGLVASTQSRLFGVAHFAMSDTRTPFRFTLVRLTAGTILGYAGAVLAAGRAAGRSEVGRCGADGGGRRGGLDRTVAAACEPAAACRRGHAAVLVRGTTLGSRACRRRGVATPLSDGAAQCHRSSRASSCCRCSPGCFSPARGCWGLALLVGSSATAGGPDFSRATDRPN